MKTEVTVTSCVPFTTLQLDNLKNDLNKMHNGDFLLVNKIDKNLLGGFTVRVADWFFDASLSSQLSKLKQTLLLA